MENKTTVGAAKQAAPTTTIKQNPTNKAKQRSFPYTVKKVITIHRKDKTGVLPTKNTQYDPEEDTSKRIGSAFKKGTTLPLGLYVLDEHETEVCMPQLIGVNSKHNEWNKMLTNYWHSISVPIPYTGLKLNLNKIVKGPGPTEWKPENTFHYVLWKYCLKYADVANNVKDVDKSTKIRFYLEDPKEVQERELAQIKLNDRATEARLRISDNEETIKNVLFMFEYIPSDPISDLLMLKKMSTDRPKEFIAFVNDADLQRKAFVKRAVAAGVLFSPAGTNMVTYNNKNIGNDLDEAIIYLDNPNNGQEKLEIIAKLKKKNI